MAFMWVGGAEALDKIRGQSHEPFIRVVSLGREGFLACWSSLLTGRGNPEICGYSLRSHLPWARGCPCSCGVGSGFTSGVLDLGTVSNILVGPCSSFLARSPASPPRWGYWQVVGPSPRPGETLWLMGLHTGSQT